MTKPQPSSLETDATTDIAEAEEAVIALTETAQFCSSKVLTAWLRR